MNRRVVYIWVGASHPHNSLFIQAQLLAVSMKETLGCEIDLLHPGIDNPREKLMEAADSGNILLWHYGGLDPFYYGIKARKNVIMIYHNITPARLLYKAQPLVAVRSLLGRLQLLFMAKSTQWITMSPYNALELHKYGFSNISICPNIVAVGDRGGSERNKHITLLYVGRIAPNKNCVSLLEHVERVANKLQAPVEFIIVGSVKPRCRHGAEFIRKYNNLHTHPWLKVDWQRNVDTQKLQVQYKKSWLCVSMSQHEGFGVPICESIAYGTPALYLECGGTESILNHVGMVPKDQMDQFADHIYELISKDQKRENLLKEQMRIVADYIPPQINKKIKEVYSPLLSSYP